MMPASMPPAWRPDRYAARRPYLLGRMAVMDAIRVYFRTQDFVEAETPALQISPGMEPNLTAFATDLLTPAGDSSRLYLHTSPEFAMKKILVAGEPRIFQMARVFRNAERASTHSPEFTMLEWYRADPDLGAIMKDCEGLLQAAVRATARARLIWRGIECDPFASWQRITVAQAFAQYADIDLRATIDNPAQPTPGRLADEARRIGIRTEDSDDWDALFFRIALDRIEPHLGHPAPTILCDYPIHMAALSRPKTDDPHIAERFELYVAGLELANAFGELTDAAQQRARFERDQKIKQQLMGFCYPIDEDFIAALAHGLPPCCGIALGIDRLVMLATGADSIDDVLWLPVARPE